MSQRQPRSTNRDTVICFWHSLEGSVNSSSPTLILSTLKLIPCEDSFLKSYCYIMSMAIDPNDKQQNLCNKGYLSHGVHFMQSVDSFYSSVFLGTKVNIHSDITMVNSWSLVSTHPSHTHQPTSYKTSVALEFGNMQSSGFIVDILLLARGKETTVEAVWWKARWWWWCWSREWHSTKDYIEETSWGI